MRRPLYLAILLVGIVFLQWQQLPVPTPHQGKPVSAIAWDLPVTRQFDAKQQLATLTAANPWGKNAQGTMTLAGPPPDPNWQILGAMKRGPESYLILQVEGEPERTLMVGNSLPGGGKILEIRENVLCVLVNKKRRLLAINSSNLTWMDGQVEDAVDDPPATGKRQASARKPINKTKSPVHKPTRKE
jgi:hypothetical protein